MRLHTDDYHSSDALKAELCRHAIIMLDGVRQTQVIWADEETGELERYISQDDPRYQRLIAENGGREWPTEVLKGYVRIKDDRDEYKPAPLTGFGCDITGRKGDES